MNYIILNRDIKSVIFNYLTIPINHTKNNYTVNFNHFKYMNLVNTSLFENKFITKLYNIIYNDGGLELSMKINNNLNIDISFYGVIYDYSVDVEYIWHYGKINRTHFYTFGINEDLSNNILLKFIKYIELIFICSNCLSFSYYRNRYLNICTKCENKNENTNKTCQLYNTEINGYLCTTKCNHNFHLKCLEIIKTYYDKNYIEYMKCSICKQDFRFIYINNNQFEFSTYLYEKFKYGTRYDVGCLEEIPEELDVDSTEIINNEFYNEETELTYFPKFCNFSLNYHDTIKYHKVYNKTEADRLLESME